MGVNVNSNLKDALDGKVAGGPLGTKGREWKLGTLIDTIDDRVIALEGEVGTGGALTVDTISEATADAGVTIDGVLVKDARVKVGLTGTVAAPINMADAAHTLVLGTAGAAQTTLTGQVIFVDANSAGTENLVLPAAADLPGVLLFVKNVGGEGITINTNVATLDAGQGCIVISDGTAWAAFSVGANT